MDRVFVLWGYIWASCGEHHDRDLLGVFSTKEKAEEVVRIWKEYNIKCYHEGFNIEEFCIDNAKLPVMYELKIMKENANVKGE